MPFVVLFQIVPPSVFGVPEHGKTVLPAGPGTFYGDAYHARLHIRAGYGTMPRYRTDEEALDCSVVLRACPARIKDNFLSVEVDADNDLDAMAAARAVAEAFTQQLGLAGGRWMAAVPLLIQSPQGEDKLAPRSVTLASVTTYDLRQLGEDVDAAARASDLADDRLLRGRAYYQHSLWLFEQRAAMPDPLESNYRMLIASVFLNLWKAASSVVGDPSSDRDYQSRYRQLGYDRAFFENQIEPIRRLRNDYDVAHYHLSPDALELVEQKFGEASATVRSILLGLTSKLLAEPGEYRNGSA